MAIFGITRTVGISLFNQCCILPIGTPAAIDMMTFDLSKAGDISSMRAFTPDGLIAIMINLEEADAAALSRVVFIPQTEWICARRSSEMSEAIISFRV